MYSLIQDMANPNPSPETRLGAPRGPKPHSRAKRDWMRKILDEKDPSGADERERIFRHQIEVAQSWEVRVVGKNGDGELLKVASGRDSTAAAEFVFGLVGLKALDVDRNRLVLAEHIRQVARDSIEIGRSLIGKQAETWTPEQIRAFWDICERDPRRFLRAAEEQLEALDVPEPAPQIPCMQSTQQEVRNPPLANGAGAEDEIAEASPKGCDMTSHAEESDSTEAEGGLRVGEGGDP